MKKTFFRIIFRWDFCVKQAAQRKCGDGCYLLHTVNTDQPGSNVPARDENVAQTILSFILYYTIHTLYHSIKLAVNTESDNFHFNIFLTSLCSFYCLIFAWFLGSLTGKRIPPLALVSTMNAVFLTEPVTTAVPSVRGLNYHICSCGLVEKLLSRSGHCVCLHLKPPTSTSAKLNNISCGLG